MKAVAVISIDFNVKCSVQLGDVCWLVEVEVIWGPSGHTSIQRYGMVAGQTARRSGILKRFSFSNLFL